MTALYIPLIRLIPEKLMNNLQLTEVWIPSYHYHHRVPRLSRHVPLQTLPPTYYIKYPGFSTWIWLLYLFLLAQNNSRMFFLPGEIKLKLYWFYQRQELSTFLSSVSCGSKRISWPCDSSSHQWPPSWILSNEHIFHFWNFQPRIRMSLRN